MMTKRRIASKQAKVNKIFLLGMLQAQPMNDGFHIPPITNIVPKLASKQEVFRAVASLLYWMAESDSVVEKNAYAYLEGQTSPFFISEIFTNNLSTSRTMEIMRPVIVLLDGDLSHPAAQQYLEKIYAVYCGNS